MDRIFRSRGIRILYEDGKTTYNEKIYYEPDESCLHSSEYINKLQSQGLIQLFEYSVINGNIDTYNYHVNLTKENLEDLYIGLPNSANDMIGAIESCFGKKMKNYTIGYRLQKDCVEQKSFYFYPTIWKGDRFGIKGMTEPNKISKGIGDFVERVSGKDILSSEELNEYVNMIYKFKGISVHIKDDELSYKIYGRLKPDLLNGYMSKYYKFDMKKVGRYGDCVLVAIRIIDKQIRGVNIYFLR